jgi:thiol-disulfide isomerase/thioredoxin
MLFWEEENMFRCVAVVIASTVTMVAAHGQSSSERRPAPKALLVDSSQRYKAASFYRIDAVEEEERNGELSRNWTKTIRSAAVGRDKKYRFAAQTQEANWLEVSDGVTELVYRKLGNDYIQHAAAAKPFKFKAPWDFTESQLIDAQELKKDIADALSMIRYPKYSSDETLMLSGKPVTCYVVEGKLRRGIGWNPKLQTQITVWIDQQTKLVRKTRTIMSGPVIMNEPDVNYTQTTVVTYPVAQLSEPPAAFFSVTVPPGANRVMRFPDPFHPTGTNLASHQAPAVTFKPPDGRAFTLKSLAGKPVLVEFWATWCAPCLEAMPSIEKLYPKLAAEGVTVLTVDEDNEPETAANFLREHHSDWTNVHDEDGDMGSAFPGNGIPEFVVIDRHGMIVGSKSGFDESWLKKMVAQAER